MSLQEVPRSLNEKNLSSQRLSFDVERFPFARGLEETEVYSILDNLRDLHREGRLEITTQVTPVDGSHQLDILLGFEEDDELQSVHFLSFPVINSQGKITGRDVSQAREVLMPFSGDLSAPGGLTEEILEKITDAVSYSLNKTDRAKPTIPDLAGKVEIIDSERGTGIVPSSQNSAIEAAREDLAHLGVTWTQQQVDLSEETAPAELMAYIDNIVSTMVGENNLPSDPTERFKLLKALHLEAADLAVQLQGKKTEIQRQNMLQEMYLAEGKIFRNVAIASTSWYRSLTANPQVKEVLDALLHVTVLRFADEMLIYIKDPEGTVNMLDIIMSKIADGQVARRTIKAKAEAAAIQSMMEAEAAGKKAQGLAQEVVNQEKENTRLAKIEVEHHGKSKGIERMERVGRGLELAMGRMLGKPFNWSRDFLLGEQNGLLNQKLPKAVKDALEHVSSFVKEHGDSLVFSPVFATGGYFAGSYVVVALEGTPLATVINPTIPVVLLTASGAVSGWITPDIIRNLGNADIRGLLRRRKRGSLGDMRRLPLRPNLSSKPPVYSPLADLDDKDAIPNQTQLSGFEPPDEE